MDLLTEIHTPSGAIEVVHQITLGDMLIATVITLHLAFGLIKWLAGKTWGGR